jgi:hypothetical protein
MIFRSASSEVELESSMEKSEREIVAEQELRNETILVTAMEELSKAAESFERAGLSKFATDVTTVMLSLAGKKDTKKNKPKSKKEKTKDKKKPSCEEKKVFKNFGFSPSDLEK